MTIKERRDALVRILIVGNHETRKSISQKLGVSKRTVQRDIDAISMLVPIFACPGHNGGVFLSDTYRAERAHITDSKQQMLHKLCSIVETNSDLMQPAEMSCLSALIEVYTKPEIK